MSDIPKKFYRFFKVFVTICNILAFIILSVITFLIISEKSYAMLFLPVIAVTVALLIELPLISYYRNIVIDVKFDSDTVIIITNSKTYNLSNKYFSEVNEDPSTMRTYIKYDDKNGFKKTFIFQMKYTPFKTYHLNIEEMKLHMPYTQFK